MKSLLVFLATAFASLLFTGCNTAQGFGKDVQKAGNKIEDKASR